MASKSLVLHCNWRWWAWRNVAEPPSWSIILNLVKTRHRHLFLVPAHACPYDKRYTGAWQSPTVWGSSPLSYTMALYFLLRETKPARTCPAPQLHWSLYRLSASAPVIWQKCQNARKTDCVHIYIYTHKHTHIYTNTHTHTHFNLFSSLSSTY